MGNKEEDEQGQLKVRPALLQDFPDSQVSGLLYQMEDKQV